MSFCKEINNEIIFQVISETLEKEGELTVRKLKQKEPLYAEFPPIFPKLKEALNKAGINKLYHHQAKAFEASKRGKNLVIVTGPASGKSLAYHLPVLNDLLEDEKATALYLFPTKALAQNQLSFLFSLGLNIETGVYDGDTAASERKYLRRHGRLILSNPDLLNLGILPQHQRWANFLKNLRFVVVDELHTLKGVFGSQAALVFRRLNRVLELYKVQPQYFMASATISNPAELAKNLTGKEFLLIKNDTAPRPERFFFFYNPPWLKEAERRRSASSVAASLLKNLTENGLKTLVFNKSKVLSELILQRAQKGLPAEKRRQLAAYRAGYLPEERRKIESLLFQEKILGVSATQALELGIDIGGLDVVVINGYPGTPASFWQQAGRTGRRGKKGYVIFLAENNPLDQYIVNNPEIIWGKTGVQAVIDPKNRKINEAHLLAAAYELPLKESDQKYFGKQMFSHLKRLTQEGRLTKKENKWHLSSPGYPASEINLRSISARPYQIVLKESGLLLGTLEESLAYLYLHPGAVYLHQGETYIVEKLLTEKRVALVKPFFGSYYTQPREESYLEILKTEEKRVSGKINLYRGQVRVRREVLGFVKRNAATGEILGVEELNLPEWCFQTEAYWFSLPEKISEELGSRQLARALHALEHAVIALFPLFALCDRLDVGGLSTPYHYQVKAPAIFFYDGYEGGLGLSTRAFNHFWEHLKAAYQLVKNCPCQEGCPSCIHSPKCGNLNETLDKKAALKLFKLLLPIPSSKSQLGGLDRN